VVQAATDTALQAAGLLLVLLARAWLAVLAGVVVEQALLALRGQQASMVAVVMVPAEQVVEVEPQVLLVEQVPQVQQVLRALQVQQVQQVQQGLLGRMYRVTLMLRGLTLEQEMEQHHD
jgi:hypothetical protein